MLPSLALGADEPQMLAGKPDVTSSSAKSAPIKVSCKVFGVLWAGKRETGRRGAVLVPLSLTVVGCDAEFGETSLGLLAVLCADGVRAAASCVEDARDRTGLVNSQPVLEKSLQAQKGVFVLLYRTISSASHTRQTRPATLATPHLHCRKSPSVELLVRHSHRCFQKRIEEDRSSSRTLGLSMIYYDSSFVVGANNNNNNIN